MREVNNGGYGQFFLSSSHDLVDAIEQALLTIGCPNTAAITRHAIMWLGIQGEVTGEKAEAVVLARNEAIREAWIKGDRASVRVGERLRRRCSRDCSGTGPGNGIPQASGPVARQERARVGRRRPNVVRLQEEQIEVAGGMLARSFFSDPLTIHMLPDGAERARLLPAHFTPFVRYGYRFGEVYTTHFVDGVAVWLPPACGEMTPERAAEAGLDRVAAALGEVPWGRFRQAMEYLERLHKRVVPGEHWYLPLIGVDPARHGQGVGTALLQPVLAQADSAGLSCYLETLEPATVPFYERHGFAIVSQGREPSSRLQYWAFRREPRKSVGAG